MNFELTYPEDDGHLRFAVAGLEEERRDEGEGHGGRDLEAGHHEVDEDQVQLAHPELLIKNIFFYIFFFFKYIHTITMHFNL
jgi:hypothetical protein